MTPDPTREQLLEQVESLKRELAWRASPPATPPVQPHAQPHDTSSQHTVITETPRQTTIETTRVPPSEQQQFRVPRGVTAKPLGVGKQATPEQIVARITAIKTVIASGVEGAGYGDKRTDFRSLTELRQILNGLEEELAEALGIGGRIRQIRITTAADKGL